MAVSALTSAAGRSGGDVPAGGLPFVDLAAEDSVGPGQTQSYELDGRRILLCNVAGELHAVEDVCSHDQGSLGEGRLHGTEIECPRHGACFDVIDGSVTVPPAVRPITSFPLRVEDGRVQVQLVPPPRRQIGPPGLDFIR